MVSNSKGLLWLCFHLLSFNNDSDKGSVIKRHIKEMGKNAHLNLIILVSPIIFIAFQKKNLKCHPNCYLRNLIIES